VTKKNEAKTSATVTPDSPLEAAAPAEAATPAEAKGRPRASRPEPSLRRLLAPLIPLYKAALSVRELRLASGMEPVRWLRWPVISIGNLSTGGAGKTPFTISLARELTSHGLPVDVLSRGYGRQSVEVTRVDPNGTAEEFGDEPLLIARETGVPVYVAAERYEAGILAESEALAAEAGAAAYAAEEDPPPLRIHLLDDGFQHRQLARAVDILLLNRQDWEDRLLPAGNLREPLEALFRANAIAIPANEPELAKALLEWGWEGPIWRLQRILEVKRHNGPVAAFCGIARPQQFFEGLEAAGQELAAQFSFPDHYDYDESIVRELIAAGSARQVQAMVTTSKDLARLGRLAELFPKTMPLETARLRIEVADRVAMLTWLVERLL
jgi:tetraacyldisaccharide 4'-kinase